MGLFVVGGGDLDSAFKTSTRGSAVIILKDGLVKTQSIQNKWMEWLKNKNKK